MEISEIQKTVSLNKIQKKEALSHPTKCEDSVVISNEAEKRMNWLEMVKEMPEIRRGISESTYNFGSNLNVVVAKKLIEEHS